MVLVSWPRKEMCPPQGRGGVLGFSDLKIQKLPNVHFMFLIDMKFISKILKN